MSDRLALSATMSVLMMAVYVLFGTEAARVPLGPDAPGAPLSIAAPEIGFEASRLLPALR
jgi:hypothetical protein